MSSRYEYARSGREKSLLLVFPEGSFEALPFEIRLAAPWTGQGYGEMSELKAAERWQVRRLGYVMLREGQLEAAGESGVETAADSLRRAA